MMMLILSASSAAYMDFTSLPVEPHSSRYSDSLARLDHVQCEGGFANSLPVEAEFRIGYIFQGGYYEREWHESFYHYEPDTTVWPDNYRPYAGVVVLWNESGSRYYSPVDRFGTAPILFNGQTVWATVQCHVYRMQLCLYPWLARDVPCADGYTELWPEFSERMDWVQGVPGKYLLSADTTTEIALHTTSTTGRSSPEPTLEATVVLQSTDTPSSPFDTRTAPETSTAAGQTVTLLAAEEVSADRVTRVHNETVISIASVALFLTAFAAVVLRARQKRRRRLLCIKDSPAPSVFNLSFHSFREDPVALPVIYDNVACAPPGEDPLYDVAEQEPVVYELVTPDGSPV